MCFNVWALDSTFSVRVQMALQINGRRAPFDLQNVKHEFWIATYDENLVPHNYSYVGQHACWQHVSDFQFVHRHSAKHYDLICRTSMYTRT